MCIPEFESSIVTFVTHEQKNNWKKLVLAILSIFYAKSTCYLSIQSRNIEKKN